jgi:hypothetical protein
MPKHTTQDPAQRALDIATHDAEVRWKRRTINGEDVGDWDYFGNVVETFNEVILMIGQPP